MDNTAKSGGREARWMQYCYKCPVIAN